MWYHSRSLWYRLSERRVAYGRRALKRALEELETDINRHHSRLERQSGEWLFSVTLTCWSVGFVGGIYIQLLALLAFVGALGIFGKRLGIGRETRGSLPRRLQQIENRVSEIPDNIYYKRALVERCRTLNKKISFLRSPLNTPIYSFSGLFYMVSFFSVLWKFMYG